MLCYRGQISCGQMSQAIILRQWLNMGLGSRKQYCTITQGLYFTYAKISEKFQLGHPDQGRQVQVE